MYFTGNNTLEQKTMVKGCDPAFLDVKKCTDIYYCGSVFQLMFSHKM